MQMRLITTMENSSSEDSITMENGVTEESPTFMEQVESHMTYTVASYINIYWFPILVPIGLVGNTLSFLVMIQPSNRKMLTCI